MRERSTLLLERIEKDALRELNKRSDAAAFLKEEDAVISQVMAEGEKLY